MKLTYEFDENVVRVTETPNEVDIEFDIRTLADSGWDGIRAIHKHFDENEVYTDVFFYYYKDHHVRVVVRQDYYVDFVLQLMRHQLLRKAEWK